MGKFGKFVRKVGRAIKRGAKKAYNIAAPHIKKEGKSLAKDLADPWVKEGKNARNRLRDHAREKAKQTVGYAHKLNKKLLKKVPGGGFAP